MTTKEQLSVKTVNNLAKQYGHWPEVFAGHQPYVNFTVKELHAFVEAVSAALAEKAGDVAGLAVATHAGADTVAVVVNLLKDGITTVLYSENHSLNGETYGVADIPADLIPTPSAQPAQEPAGWVQYVDGQKTQNFLRDEQEVKSCKEIFALMGKGVESYRPVYFATHPLQKRRASRKPTSPKSCASTEQASEDCRLMTSW